MIKSFQNFVTMNKFQDIFLIFLAIVVGIFLIGPNLKAEFGLIDDHEIVHWLGPDQKMELREIPELLLNTEIGKYGKYPRYRPSYYGIKLVETYLWSNQAIGWYAFRLFTFVFFSSILLILLKKYFGLPISILTYMYVVSGKYWGDILSRLGPAEIYAVPGLALYAAGYYLLWEKRSNYSMVGWISLFSGFMITIGAKENFLFLILPTLILVIKLIKQKKFSKLGLIMSIIMLGYFTLITTSIFFSAIHAKSDIYGANISIKDRLFELLDYGKTVSVLVMKTWEFKSMILILGFMLLNGKLTAKGKKEILKITLIYFSAELFLLSIFLSQYIYYRNTFPTGIRYDFPAMIIPIFMCALIARYFSAISYELKIKCIKPISYVILGVFLIQRIDINQFYETRAQVERNSETTRKYMVQIETNTETLKNHPEVPLVIESNNPFDYEMILSLRKYFYYFDVSNDVLLWYKSGLEYTDSSLGIQLDKVLRDISENGLEKRSWSFLSYDTCILSDGCYSITIGDAKSDNCEVLGKY